MHEVAAAGPAIAHAAESQATTSDHCRKGSTTKRKRPPPQIQSEWAPFAIADVTTSTTLSSQQALQPRRVILRSAIPLTVIIPAAESDETSLPQLFFSSLPILDDLNCGDGVNHRALIVDRLFDQSLYIIEPVGGGFFTILPLPGWVTLTDIDALAAGTPQDCKPSSLGLSLLGDCNEDTWWQQASAPIDGHDGAVSGFRGKPSAGELFQESGMADQAFKACGHDSQANMSSRVEAADSCNGESFSPLIDALDAIKLHYKEALYGSEAPLTYFAKGPLSRARSCFCNAGKTSHDVVYLIEHLKSFLLPMAVLDKKYKRSVPDVIKDLPFVSDHDEDTTSLLPSTKKPRKSKKTGIRKNGLYPSEETNISIWWFGKVKKRAVSELQVDRDDFSRQLLNDLKARELQLQIILLLEILALENSKLDAQNAEVPSQDHLASEENSALKSAKPKIVADTPVFLDLCLDRLSIWQTMTFEDVESMKETSKATSKTRSPNEKKAEDRSNQLQAFCVDVVIPFYISRLPDKAKMICRKLGGPQDPSPKRPVPAKSLQRIRDSKNGSASRHSMGSTARKTLERVLTDERPSSRRHTPSLSRSATESSLPALKREVSDHSLISVPAFHRPVAQRYSQREVDLKKSSEVTEAKVKRKAQIDIELQSAIAALKKPNAREAVKEFVDAADKRTQNPRSRKPLNPIRNPFAAQVMATPRKGKDKGDVGGAQLPRVNSAASPRHFRENRTSASKVACSVVKNSKSRSSLPAGPSYKPTVALEVEQTPTRGVTRFVDREDKKQPVASLSFEESVALGHQEKASNAPESPKLPKYPPRMLGERLANATKKSYHAFENAGELSRCVEATPLKGQKILSFSENTLKVVTPPQSPEPCLVLDDPEDAVDLL